MSIEALFATPTALPTVPKVVQELIQSFSREDVAVDEIATKLAADPVLSAKTLRLANSAYFHVSRHIGTVDDALRMLGFVMVRNLVVGCGVAGSFKSVPGMDLPQFWRHSLHTACAARWLAPMAGLNADLAFTVGLVHGLGQLLMHTVQPARMAPLDHECHPLAAERAALEQARLGYHQGQASAALALRWKFPAEMAEPLGSMPDPRQAEPPNPLSALLHVAVWRARVQALHFSAEQAAASCPAAVAELLGLGLSWRRETSTLDVDHAGLTTVMPALEELSQGLETMLK